MNTPKTVPEEFLQYVWENRLFMSDSLKTVFDETLEIIDIGRRNTDSGPDFFNAKIKIDNTIWAGNIEIHKNGSDWNKHNHQTDKAYNNVILHVVEVNDQQIVRDKKEVVPTLLLKYPEYLKTNYQNLLDAKTWIACENQFHKIDPIVLQLGFNRLMIERLEDKTEEIITRLQQNNNDWNTTFYQMLARMFGFKVNAVPFELLAKTLPIEVLAKHKSDLFQIEALLFGNSGLLNDQLLGDDYYLKLRSEYSFLRKKYKLNGIESHLWKYMRLRPGNFPTVRISQLAGLIYRSHGLFSKIIEIKDLTELKTLFKVNASGYWDSHYSFNKTSRRNAVKEIGDNSVNMIIINIVIPFLPVLCNGSPTFQIFISSSRDCSLVGCKIWILTCRDLGKTYRSCLISLIWSIAFSGDKSMLFRFNKRSSSLYIV